MNRKAILADELHGAEFILPDKHHAVTAAAPFYVHYEFVTVSAIENPVMRVQYVLDAVQRIANFFKNIAVAHSLVPLLDREQFLYPVIPVYTPSNLLINYVFKTVVSTMLAFPMARQFFIFYRRTFSCPVLILVYSAVFNDINIKVYSESL